ncbi:hypothetical protein BS78_K126400 [Paspalum vaginatum]|uniref:O-methyltransferase C-terminal domain-containing protein n=1 Tax=Paspalum vaginatum TaxID=158149 RepID=A0A9W7X7Y1_9POAL|nr:hypothetical protein BS78_K126400 [Paspalum vaginatum]
MESIQEQHCTNQQAMLDAQLELWHSSIAFIKSMAFKSALELNIADAIHLLGGTATLAQISTRPGSTRPRYHASKSADDGDHVYGLTPASRLLVGTLSLTPILSLFLNNIFVSPFFDLGTWLQHELPAADLTLFEMSHRKAVWDVVGHDASMSLLFNTGMVADTHSLIDVAGGHGAAAQAIAKAFPHIECSVLDLAHVVASAPACTGLNYIVGDMFESIPPANAVFLKWVIHDWDDPQCVTILKNCKKAIPPRDVGEKEMRQEWGKIIYEAGFIDYKITPILGLRSFIELYP